MTTLLEKPVSPGARAVASGTVSAGRPSALVEFAASRGWAGALCAMRADGRPLEAFAMDGSLVRNSRYAVELDEAALSSVDAIDAGAVAITASGALGGCRERVRVSRAGRVLGVKRAYSGESAPAALPRDWPHVLLLRPQAVSALDLSAPLPAAFDDLVALLRARGVAVAAVAVAGAAWDLSTDEGLLAFAARSALPCRASRVARVAGAVAVERGASVARDAVIVGPSFVCAGARVGQGAVVARSILAPGAVVPDGAVVRDRVLLEGDEAGESASAPPRAPVPPRPSAYRRWPLLSYARLGKRVLDVAASLLALALLAVVLPLVAAAIKLTSRGPVFYAQKRQGLHGREFGCLKFRTMTQDPGGLRDALRSANKLDGPQFKMDDDPRITLVGEFLRETNLDELPQFLNVLAGHMSIVGPRPSPDDENQMCPMWREARLSVRPGITGLWQVARSPLRDNDFQEWIRYDVDYVRNLSFALDVSVMARTAWVFVRGFVRFF